MRFIFKRKSIQKQRVYGVSRYMDNSILIELFLVEFQPQVYAVAMQVPMLVVVGPALLLTGEWA